jgi:hypothetical protein
MLDKEKLRNALWELYQEKLIDIIIQQTEWIEKFRRKNKPVGKTDRRIRTRKTSSGSSLQDSREQEETNPSKAGQEGGT